jgi:REP element-mobilizing transposase RayT
MNRGNARVPIYLVDDDYEIFLEVLKESSKFFQVYLAAYCLMPNHYHLLLTTPKANLARFMRHVDGVYTQRFNRYHKKDGHLFRGRYKAILVQEDEYLTHLVRYIHLNPVQAHLVQDPKDWLWSSHKAYLKAQDEEWLKVTPILKIFSKSLRKAKRAYLEFIHGGIDPKTKAFFSAKKPGPIFGDVDFIEAIKEKFLARQDDQFREVPEVRPLKGERMIHRIKKEVSQKYKVSQETLCLSKRGERNRPRTMAVALARELSGLRLKELAGHFKVGSYKTISAHHRNLIRSVLRDAATRRLYDEIKMRCIQIET